MVRNNVRMMAVAVCLVGVSCSGAVAPKDPTSGLNAPVSDPKPIEGLWFGSWGGGERDGVGFQPVIAELFIKGADVEMYGFRNVSRLTGTVRFDVNTKQMQITPAAEAGGQPAPKTIDYACEIKGDELTLIDEDKFPISLLKLRVVESPLANTDAEIVEAVGINDAGDLLVTTFNVVRAGRAGTEYFQLQDQKLNAKQATILVVQETRLKQVTVDEARALIRESTPVVVTYRHDDRLSLQQSHELWKEMGSPMPDSDAVQRTFLRILRPGTLVFILSARENVPVP